MPVLCLQSWIRHHGGVYATFHLAHYALHLTRNSLFLSNERIYFRLTLITWGNFVWRTSCQCSVTMLLMQCNAQYVILEFSYATPRSWRRQWQRIKLSNEWRWYAAFSVTYPAGQRDLRVQVVVLDWPAVSRMVVDLTLDACTTNRQTIYMTWHIHTLPSRIVYVLLVTRVFIATR